MYADFIELNGDLPGEMHAYLGGKFTFWERIKSGGTGSPKLVYCAGNSLLDVAADMNPDLNFSNIELFPNGLVIRLYKVNKMVAVAIRKEEIQSINTYSEILHPGANYFNIKLKAPNRTQQITFEVLANAERPFTRFLKHAWFKCFQIEHLQMI
ncbi:MAG: hypothetical protein KTR13_04405 [Saprospiraceae bacterium]|nr:hypothetical protein [Saprospiraceae bacterium]